MPLYLVAYDIPDDRRRVKVAKALARFGVRVQYSVFLAERGNAAEIAQAISPVLEAGEDDVRIHPLCATCHGRAVLLGRAARTARLSARFTVV
jgi:CRISPR-associated protein Cas2